MHFATNQSKKTKNLSLHCRISAMHVLFLQLLAATIVAAADVDGSAAPQLSKERAIFTTEFGDIQMAFYPEVGISGTSL
jgi:hypothetical protein